LFVVVVVVVMDIGAVLTKVEAVAGVVAEEFAPNENDKAGGAAVVVGAVVGAGPNEKVGAGIDELVPKEKDKAGGVVVVVVGAVLEVVFSVVSQEE
jgi:hypothetical protein